MTRVLVVDAANVVGSRPDGWWKDRAGAARRLHERLLVADTSYDEIVLVLEGAAKGGAKAGRDGHLLTEAGKQLVEFLVRTVPDLVDRHLEQAQRRREWVRGEQRPTRTHTQGSWNSWVAGRSA